MPMNTLTFRRRLLVPIALALVSCGSPAREQSYGPLPPEQDPAESDDDEPTSAPPAPSIDDIVYERRPGYVRVEGRWLWTPREWAWVSGTFVPERPGFTYVQGHWDKSGAVWTWKEPQWVEDRVGQVWRRGYWSDESGQMAWVPGEWESRRPGYTFERGRWEQRGDRLVWAPGRWRKSP